MTDQAALVAVELQRIDDFVNSTVNQMEKAQLEAGTHNPVILKMLREGLKPLLVGIFLAQGLKASPLDVEDTLMNIFCITMVEYYRRRFHTKGGPQPVIENAQEIVNTIGHTLSLEIASHFKQSMAVPVSRKIH